jgi:hypothetical protein
MSNPVIIPEHDVADLREAAQRAVREAGLAELVQAVAPGPYGHSATGLRLLEAVELGGACLMATRRAISGRIGADRRAGFAAGGLTAEEERFASLVAAFVAANEALAACEAAPEKLPPAGKHLPLEDYRALMTAPEAELLAGFTADVASYLTFYRNHANPAVRLEGAGDGEGRLRQCLASYFALTATTAARLGDDGDLAGARHALEEAGLQIHGATYRGFARQTAIPTEEERDVLPFWPGDIVGNKDVLAAGMELARAVAGFDLERGVNPRNLRNPVLFMLGAPGCGKTVTAHAVANYFLDLCREHAIPARFRIIRRTDWASHYQNKSANELLRIFKEEVFDFPGVAGVYWPDIDTAFAAREDPGIRAEEKAILGTLFGLLDGTVGPRNGKWFMIADANFLTMDEATLSRLSQDPHHAKGPQTVDDFVTLLRDKKLGKVRDHLLLDDLQWQAFGARCSDAGLSGRAIDNLGGKLLAIIDDVAVPDHFFSLSYDEKVALLEQGRKTVDAAELDTLLDRYIQFEREAEERARTERFERRVVEIREQLAARLAAVGAPEL